MSKLSHSDIRRASEAELRRRLRQIEETTEIVFAPTAQEADQIRREIARRYGCAS